MIGKDQTATEAIAEELEATPSVAVEEQRLSQELSRLIALVEQDAIEEARAWVRELQRRWPDAPRVRHWARVLAPPEILPGGAHPDRSLDRERDWLKLHAHEYAGCWLAVYEDRLVAADPDLRAVLAATREAIGERGTLLHFQPKTQDSNAGDTDLSR